MTDALTILDSAQRSLESILYEIALGKSGSHKAEILRVVQTLNDLLSEDAILGDINKSDILPFATYVLNIYSSVKANESRAIASHEVIIWLTSKINGLLAYPLVAGQLFLAPEEEYRGLALPVPAECRIQEWRGINEISQISWTEEGMDDIYQDLSPNCSFVSALLSCAHNNKVRLVNSIFPNQKSAKYAIILHVNGTKRRIIIDDRIPIIRNDNSALYVRSLTNQSLLWPALLEKGYFMLSRQGYDHQGSNFGVDAYLLTGWVIEFYSISSLSSSRLKELHALFQRNDILLGIGTGDLTPEECAFYKLLPHHDYSVVGMVNDPQGELKFVIKNPLLGRNDIRRCFEVSNFDLFEQLYVNINPEIYKYKHSISFVALSRNITFEPLYHKQQFKISADASQGCLIRVLLERHMVDNDMEQDASHLRLDVYSSSGEKLWLSNRRRIFKGAEMNGRFYACSFHLSEPSCTAVLTQSTDTKRSNIFTLKAFSDDPFTIQKALNKYSRLREIKGTLNSTNCHGTHYDVDFIRNPQYHLCLRTGEDKQVNMTISLHADYAFTNLSIFVKTDTNFRFLTNFAATDVVAFEREYCKGSVTYQDLKLRTNTSYVLIPSLKGEIIDHIPYSILFNYDEKPDITFELCEAPYALGLFTKELKLQWKSTRKCAAKVIVPKSAIIVARGKQGGMARTERRAGLRLTLLKLISGSTPLVQTSYKDSVYGTFLKASVEAGTYVIYVEREEITNQDHVTLELGMETSFELFHLN